MKKYLPTIYVTEWGEVLRKEDIINKMKKTLKTKTDYEKINENIYIHTIKVVKITEQYELFKN